MMMLAVSGYIRVLALADQCVVLTTTSMSTLTWDLSTSNNHLVMHNGEDWFLIRLFWSSLQAFGSSISSIGVYGLDTCFLPAFSLWCAVPFPLLQQSRLHHLVYMDLSCFGVRTQACITNMYSDIVWPSPVSTLWVQFPLSNIFCLKVPMFASRFPRHFLSLGCRTLRIPYIQIQLDFFSNTNIYACQQSEKGKQDKPRKPSSRQIYRLCLQIWWNCKPYILMPDVLSLGINHGYVR